MSCALRLLRPNRSVNTDAQKSPRLWRSSSLGAGYVRRVAASGRKPLHSTRPLAPALPRPLRTDQRLNGAVALIKQAPTAINSVAIGTSHSQS